MKFYLVLKNRIFIPFLSHVRNEKERERMKTKNRRRRYEKWSRVKNERKNRRNCNLKFICQINFMWNCIAVGSVRAENEKLILPSSLKRRKNLWSLRFYSSSNVLQMLHIFFISTFIDMADFSVFLLFEFQEMKRGKLKRNWKYLEFMYQTFLNVQKTQKISNQK